MADEPKPQPPEIPRPDPVDWFLGHLVEMANDQEGFTPGLTLHVGGLVVSGQLISGHVWFEAFAKDVAQTITDPLEAAAGKAYFEALGNRVYGPEGLKNKKPVQFIHLRDAKVLSSVGVALPSDTGAFWRGRLTAVDGYHLGMLREAKP